MLRLFHERRLLKVQQAFESLLLSCHCELYDGDVPAERRQRHALIRTAREQGQLEGYEALVTRLEMELGYLQACMLLRRRRFDEAARQCRNLLQHNPDNWVLHLRLAEARLGQGELSKAKVAVRQALELGADAARCFLLLGRIEQQLGRSRLARYHFQRAAELAPHDQEIRQACQASARLGELLLEKMRNLLALFKPDPRATSLRYQHGLLTIEDLRRLGRKLVGWLFLEIDQVSFRYQPGLLTVQDLGCAAHAVALRLHPAPAEYSFKFTGLI